jgi:hypothetical protein
MSTPINPNRSNTTSRSRSIDEDEDVTPLQAPIRGLSLRSAASAAAKSSSTVDSRVAGDETKVNATTSAYTPGVEAPAVSATSDKAHQAVSLPLSERRGDGSTSNNAVGNGSSSVSSSTAYSQMPMSPVSSSKTAAAASPSFAGVASSPGTTNAKPGPGAVAVGVIASPGAVAVDGQQSNTNATTSIVVSNRNSPPTTNDSTTALRPTRQPLEHAPIVAQLVPDEDEIAMRVQKQIEQRMQLEITQRLESERIRQTVAVSAVAIDESPSSNGNGVASANNATITSTTSMTNKPCGFSKQAWYWIIILLVILLAGIAAGVVLLLFDNGGDDEMDSTPRTSTPTLAKAPTLSPTRYTTPAFDNLLQLLEPELFTTDEGNSWMDNPDSTKYQALEWLANEDEWTANLLQTSSFATNAFVTQLLVERFVLVQFYLSTKGTLWTNQYSFLTSNTSVCEWKDPVVEQGVLCDENDRFVQTLWMGAFCSGYGVLPNISHP